MCALPHPLTSDNWFSGVGRRDECIRLPDYVLDAVGRDDVDPEHLRHLAGELFVPPPAGVDVGGVELPHLREAEQGSPPYPPRPDDAHRVNIFPG